MQSTCSGRGGLTLQAGSLWDGDVFRITMSKVHPEDMTSTENGKVPAEGWLQVRAMQCIHPIVPPSSRPCGDTAEPGRGGRASLHPLCCFPWSQHTEFPCCCQHCAAGSVAQGTLLDQIPALSPPLTLQTPPAL